MAIIQCPACYGHGQERVFHNTGADSAEHYATEETCSICHGSGNADDQDEAVAKIIKVKSKFTKLLNGIDVNEPETSVV